MLEKFDPAPIDKNAADPQQAAGVDREKHAKLEAGLIDTFPASDPVSAKERGSVNSSPMTATATPVSAATEQEH